MLKRTCGHGREVVPNQYEEYCQDRDREEWSMSSCSYGKSSIESKVSCGVVVVAFPAERIEQEPRCRRWCYSEAEEEEEEEEEEEGA